MLVSIRKEIMRKTYTITVDRAKAQTFSKGLIWHNDKDSTKTVQCEESIEDVKKKAESMAE